MDLGYSLFIVAIFAAVVLLVEGVYLAWNRYKGPDARRLEKRLRILSAGAAEVEDETLLNTAGETPPWLRRLMVWIPRVSILDRWLQQSGLVLSLSRLAVLMAMTGVAVFLGLLVLRLPFIVSVLGGVAGGSLPALRVAYARSSRLKQFAEQLPEALELISRALKSGYALPSAMQLLATESPEPIATEFRITTDEISYGVAFHDAMKNLANRVPNTDLGFFVIAVQLQRETGGNLTELIENLSALVRARFKIFGRIRILTAEGRLSAYIMTALPFGVALLMYTANPAFLSVLWTDPAGLKLLSTALVGILLGGLIMWRTVKIRV